MSGLGARLAAIPRYPRLLALGLGALAATGFPPLALWPVALLAMGGLGWIVAAAPTRKRAFLLGWLFGVAHFTLANNWIATAFTYQAEMPAALGWVAVPLLALYLAVYPALAALLAHGVAPRGRFPLFAVAFAGSWIVTEWARGWVFTGFAWDPFSLVLLGPFGTPGLAAALPWTGTYGLSGLAVLLACGTAWLIARRGWLRLALAALLVAAGMYVPVGDGREGNLAFTLVQPDVRQHDLDNPAMFEEQFATIANLSVKRQGQGKRLVLWPESGVPDYLEDGYPQRYYDRMTAGGDPVFARYRIGRVIGEDSLLLTGAVDLEIENNRAVGAYNSVTALDAGGRIVGSYAKAHLVPYGEYLALRWLLEPLGATRLVAGTIDFIPGPGPRTLDLGNWGQAGIQICYEIVFSGEVVDPARRPDYIFNPSNDGWFGSWGPPQHLAQARMRAIEEALPVLRATTTGISAVIDSRGVVREFIPMHRAARMDGAIPPAGPPTLFSRFGNILALSWAVVFLAIAAVARWRRPR